MRRSLLPFALFLSIVAALLTGVAVTAGAASTTYGSSSPYGVFYVKPGDFAVGDTVTLAANFPSNQKKLNVTFFKRVGDTDTFEEIGVDKSNTNGNAYLTDYLLDEGQTLFARSSKGKQTQLFEVDGESGPSTCARAGTIYTTPALVTPGASVTIAANFLSDQKYLNVSFYKVTGETEELFDTDESNRYGNAYLTDVQIDAELKIRAETDEGKCTKILTITPKAIDPDDFADEQGAFYIRPGDVREGEEGELAANFASSKKNLDVTFFRKASDDSWESVGSDVSNSSGNAYLPGFAFEGSETFFGLTETGVRTPVETIVPLKFDDVTDGPETLGNHVLYVQTDDRKIPSTKGVQHTGRAAWKTDGVDGELSEVFDLETLSVRGNTTSKQSKKPFKLKFDKKREPFDLSKDKTWVLLANFNDRSFVRTFSGLDLASRLDGLDWASEGVFTEVFVNGSYRGSYQLIQSIKIDGDRVDVTNETGQIIEFDPWWKIDGVPGMEGPGEFKYLDYAWKDPDEFSDDPEDLNSKKVSDMKEKIRNFEKVLYGSNWTKDWSKEGKKALDPEDDWQTYLDLDSAVDYYFVKEFTKDTDSDMYRSNYFYTDDVDPDSDAKFFMGPVWDFDRSAGARYYSKSMPRLDDTDGWWLRGYSNTTPHNTRTIHWYTRLTKDPRFLTALEDRWAVVKDEFSKMSTETVSNGVTALGGGDYDLGLQVMENDIDEWGSKTDRLKPKTNPYTPEGELNYVRGWYSDRFDFFDEELG